MFISFVKNKKLLKKTEGGLNKKGREKGTGKGQRDLDHVVGVVFAESGEGGRVEEGLVGEQPPDVVHDI